MLTSSEADELAHRWIDAWNDHDLERIIAHYADEIVFSSPFIQRIGSSDSGAISGRDALSTYFRAALDKFPELTFRLQRVFRGIDSITLMYESVNGLLAAETMILTPGGQVTRVLAQYDRW
ncbi:MAG: nuclear transport factor 2 family protein [Acidobacteriota bacterium]